MILYLLPTFEPERAIPPGKGRITSGQRLMAATAASAAASVAAGSLPMRMMLPPATPLTVPNDLLAKEFAVHHRDAPVAPAADPLGDLPAVAEIAELAADADRLLADRQAVVARGGRAGHHALADAVGDRLFQRVAS